MTIRSFQGSSKKSLTIINAKYSIYFSNQTVDTRFPEQITDNVTKLCSQKGKKKANKRPCSNHPYITCCCILYILWFTNHADSSTYFVACKNN